MTPKLPTLAAIAALLLSWLVAGSALAQKPGGILRMYHFDSPASLSLHEEVTFAALGPAMGLFNNLVMFDQHVAQASFNSIVPDLATEWSWDSSKTELRFSLHEGVKWHDGKPFTADDVKCTWDTLLGKSGEKLRLNPRKAWYRNLEEVKTDDDYSVSFVLKRPQPAFLMLLATGMSPIYPCHVPARDMRSHPIGTGPFKFVEFKPNEYIKVTKNPDYWKPGHPYLDGIEYTIIREQGPRDLAFFAGRFDMTGPFGVSMATLEDFKSQAPQAGCEISHVNVPRTMLINPAAPPFDNPELRRAMTLSVDRKAFVDIETQGEGRIGGNMMPPPEGVWGMPPEVLQTLPGYDADVDKRRAEARRIMGKLGYGPDRHLVIKVATRNFPGWRDPAVIMISHFKEIYIDGELDLVDTALWCPKMARRDYAVGFVPMESGVDDPDQMYYENYVCSAARNYTGYCDPELDKLVNQQSMEVSPQKRKDIVWQIERRLAEAAVRPVLFYPVGATCRQPWVKGLTIMTNSIYNEWRMEDVWLDK